MSKKHWSIKTAIEQVTKCDFECQGGPLSNNEGWIWLVDAAKVGPEFWPGQGVWFEIAAEVAGQTITKMAHFYIVGCWMDSTTDARVWKYSLSNDPPAPYHYGTVQFKGVPASKLHLTDSASLTVKDERT